MLNFVNKKGKKVMEMNDKGDLNVLDETLAEKLGEPTQLKEDAPEGKLGENMKMSGGTLNINENFTIKGE